MPTYDYQCRSCGNVTEVIHPMTEDGPTTCEICGGPLRRVLYPAGIIFKGSGFYKTDSRSSSKSAASKPASGDSKPADTTTTPAKAADGSSSTESGTSGSNASASSPKGKSRGEGSTAG